MRKVLYYCILIVLLLSLSGLVACQQDNTELLLN